MVDKKGEALLRVLLVLAGVFVILAVTYFVLAGDIIETIGGSGLRTYLVNEDVIFDYNISINNTFALSNNFTGVYITLSSNISFQGGNATSGNATACIAKFDYDSTLNALNWTNVSVLVAPGRNYSFWFNATVTTPGVYTFNVTISNLTAVYNTTTITVTINDTTMPWNVSFISPANGTNVSSLAVNVRSSDNFNISNFRIVISNNTDAAEVTNNTSPRVGTAVSNYSYVFSGLASWTYIISSVVNDTNNNQNTSIGNRSVTLDVTQPNITYVTNGMDINGANFSTNFIYINVTATDGLGLANVTLQIFNSTGLINQTVNATSYAIIDRLGINISKIINPGALTDNIYYINATATDIVGNRNSTVTWTFTKDTNGPVITLTSAVTKTTVTVTATISDALTAGNTTCSSTRGTVSGTTSTGSSIAETGLACGTEYDYTLTCYDLLGNSNSTHINASTSACGDAAGTAGGGGGGGGYLWTNTYVPDTTTFFGGTAFTKSLGAKDRIKYAIKNTEHYVGVLEVGATNAKITVASAPQEATLNVGDIKKFEVTGDNYYDIEVTLNAIKDGKADLSVKYIQEVKGTTEAGAAAGGEGAAGAGAAGAGEAAAKTSTGKIILIVIAVLVIAGIAVWIFKRKK